MWRGITESSLKQQQVVAGEGGSNGLLREIYGELTGGGLSVTREGLLWNQSLLLSSPLRLSTYPLSHQSVSQASSAPVPPAAFLRPVRHSHFTADRLMPLHELQAPHMPARREEDRGRVDMCRERGVEEKLSRG